MNQGTPLLIVDSHEGFNRIKIEYITKDNIPDLLNGESGFHIYHVRLLTELILRQVQGQSNRYGLDEETIMAISIASSLHDIGKTQVPKSILDFPGKLSPLEFDIVKKHTVFGANIIQELPSEDVDDVIVQYAKEIAQNHHERIDGTGYPIGLMREDIPLAAQVVSLADSYDALTSTRSYKQAFSQDVAIQMITSGMCGVFDEELIECLLKVVNYHELVEIREKFNQGHFTIQEQIGFAPERVLCIGNTEYLTEQFINDTFPNSKVMVVGNTDLEGAEHIKLFKIRKPSIQAILDTYEFDIIIYFSGELTFHTTEKSDSEELREVLKYAKELQKDVRILYLASLDSSFTEQDDFSILSAAKEGLCDHYAKEGKVEVKIVQIPYLYSGTRKGDFLFKIFEQMNDNQTVRIDEDRFSKMYFISQYDLSELLQRLIDNWKSGTGILTVNDDFQLTFKDLADRIVALKPEVRIDFAEHATSKTLTANNKALRNEYGWFSKISIVEDLEEQYEQFLLLKNEKEYSFLDKVKLWLAKHSGVMKVIELFVLFMISELLIRMTDSAIVFSIVDFRMVYIVVMATVHGLNYGLAAAGLSSISWFVAKINSGTNALTIFYEPTNWLAFVFFFTVGALCGYVKLRSDDKIRSVKDENKTLENKLIFVREIYDDTLREKRDLKKQIIGSKDSFGKIFDITRKLDTVEPQQLYLRIIDTFEDVLDNKGVTVYSIHANSMFGRLEVASRDIIGNVAKSISTETYSPVMEVLERGEIWRNNELIPELPMYAAGVYRGKSLVLMIFLWQAGMDQRSLYYINLFKILRDLVQMSLLRAYDYNQAIYEKQYITGTNIMRADAFAECVKNYEALVERKVFSYVLLEFDFKGKSLQEANELLKGRVRNNDILGISYEGNIRLLLSQATSKDLEFILPRFEVMDIEVTILK